MTPSARLLFLQTLSGQPVGKRGNRRQHRLSADLAKTASVVAASLESCWSAGSDGCPTGSCSKEQFFLYPIAGGVIAVDMFRDILPFCSVLREVALFETMLRCPLACSAEVAAGTFPSFPESNFSLVVAGRRLQVGDVIKSGDNVRVGLFLRGGADSDPPPVAPTLAPLPMDLGGPPLIALPAVPGAVASEEPAPHIAHVTSHPQLPALAPAGGIVQGVLDMPAILAAQAAADHRARPNGFWLQHLSSNSDAATRASLSHYHSSDLPDDADSVELSPQFVIFDVNFNSRGICMAMYRLAIYPGNPALLVGNRDMLSSDDLMRYERNRLILDLPFCCLPLLTPFPIILFL